MDTATARKMHDDLMASRPEGASHNSDICAFCVDKATQQESTTSRVSDGPGETDTTEKEGGTSPMTQQSTEGLMSQETHNALRDQAVSQATATTESALATKTAEADQAKARVTELETELASVKGDNERLNGELDSAQVELKSAQEKVTSLEADLSERDEQARLTEVATARAEQVRTLGLFTDEVIKNRAGDWAKLADEDWAGRIEDWRALKPAGAEGDTASASTTKTDTASAMTGSSEDLTKEQTTDTASTKPNPRRAALGLS